MHSILAIRRWLPVVLTLFVIASAGCAGRGKVTGKVTYKGQPMPGGTVFFHGPSGVPSGSAVINPADGTYSIELPVGERKVSVTPASPRLPSEGKGGPKGKSKDGKLPPDGSAKTVEKKEWGAKHVPVPVQYTDPEKSSLKVTIKGGSTPFDIAIP